jgi:anti-anti-sigma regulatory factor
MVLACEGALDTPDDLAGLRREGEKILGGESATLAIDLRMADYLERTPEHLNGKLLALFVEWTGRLREQGRRLVIIEPNPGRRQTISLLGLDKVLDIRVSEHAGFTPD